MVGGAEDWWQALELQHLLECMGAQRVTTWETACRVELSSRAERMWEVQVEQAHLGVEVQELDAGQMQLPVRRGSEAPLQGLLSEPCRSDTCTHV